MKQDWEKVKKIKREAKLNHLLGMYELPPISADNASEYYDVVDAGGIVRVGHKATSVRVYSPQNIWKFSQMRNIQEPSPQATIQHLLNMSKHWFHWLPIMQRKRVASGSKQMLANADTINRSVWADELRVLIGLNYTVKIWEVCPKYDSQTELHPYMDRRRRLQNRWRNCYMITSRAGKCNP